MVNKIKKTDTGRAKRFENVFKFTDETAIKYCGEFKRNFNHQIYLPESQLKR